jgi:hypothetical protein
MPWKPPELPSLSWKDVRSLLSHAAHLKTVLIEPLNRLSMRLTLPFLVRLIPFTVLIFIPVLCSKPAHRVFNFLPIIILVPLSFTLAGKIFRQGLTGEIAESEFAPEVWASFPIRVVFAYAAYVSMFATVYYASSNLGCQIMDSYHRECIHGYLNYLYFSIVTACTLGYGDFIPQSWARLFAALEVTFFWFLLAGAALLFDCYREKSKKERQGVGPDARPPSRPEPTPAVLDHHEAFPGIPYS